MGWDFYTYENQPPFFIDEIVVFLNQESLREKNKTKEQELKMRTGSKSKGHSRHG